jgi:hypothetical protein
VDPDGCFRKKRLPCFSPYIRPLHIGSDFADERKSERAYLPEWGHFEVPHEAQPGQAAQDGVRDVDLARVEAVLGGAHVAVVVVVPALPQGGQRQPQVVARVTVRLELTRVAPAANQVGHRVDAIPGTEPRKRLKRWPSGCAPGEQKQLFSTSSAEPLMG